MAEESSGGGRDPLGRFRRKKEDAEVSDAAAEDAGGTEDAGDDTEDAGVDTGDAGDEMETIDISDTTAPSIGPHSTMKRHVPQAQVAPGEEPSNVDAMGLDKRRQVIGQSYGPSAARQLTVYGVFLAVMAAVVIGFLLLAKELDKAPASNPDEAPWSQQDAPQDPPLPLE